LVASAHARTQFDSHTLRQTEALYAYRGISMIRNANQSDCLNLAALSLQVWLHTYATSGLRAQISQYALSTFTERRYSELLKQSSHDIGVYEEDDRLLGLVVVDLDSTFNGKPETGYEVVNLYVSQHAQGRGIGSKLLKEIERLHGLPFWLSTWVKNEGAIEFYKKLGFRIIGELNFNLEGELHRNYVLSYAG